MSRRFVEGVAAAILVVVVAWGVDAWVVPLARLTIGAFGVLGFLLGWFVGEEVIDFLKTVALPW